MTKQRPASPRPGPTGVARAGGWKGAVPVATRNYLAHVEKGQTIRALAKEADVHPSTVLRRVRRVEALRDDPLLDAALRRLATPQRTEFADPDPDAALRRQAAAVLRQLGDPGTVLAIARDMEKGVVAREGPEGEPIRLGVVERSLAEEMAVRGWIATTSVESKVQRYRITHKGRQAVRGGRPRASGLEEEGAVFVGPAGDDDRLHHMRSGLLDTPLQNLSRRRDENGDPFLTRELVAAGERLQDDYELAVERGERLPDWDEFLEDLPDAGLAPVAPGQRPGDRLLRALRELGPGLADAALRCCCLLEGLEMVEKRMNWSARSGKVVLRLALWRLQTHYRIEDSRASPLIG